MIKVKKPGIKTSGKERFLKKQTLEVVSDGVGFKLVEVISISAKHVSTGQIGAYIKKIYKEEGFKDFGYKYVNDGKRFIIYTLVFDADVKQYFIDRCPAMVENECRALKGEAHQLKKITLRNGKVIDVVE